MKKTVLILICFIVLTAISMSTESYCEEQISLQFYNDENRSIQGQGYWTAPPYYDECYNGVDDTEPIYEGWRGIGEAWLWIYTGELEINEIEFYLRIDGEFIYPPPCAISYWLIRNPSAASSFEFTDIQFILGEYSNTRVSLNDCQKGLILIGCIRIDAFGWWRLSGTSGVATLCNENQNLITTLGSIYNLIPEYHPIINNEESTWGAIKSLCK